MKLKVVVSLLLLFALIIPTVVSAQTWSGITEVTPENNYETDSEPVLVVYNNDLYVIWQTLDSNTSTINGENDFDIVDRVYDGGGWSNIHEISPVNDSGADRNPDAAVYKNELYIVWSTCDNTTSIGTDFDIVIRRYDGSWGNIVELTPKDDTGNDFNPKIIVYNGMLYVVWQTWDNKTSNGDDADIVLRCYDGSEWSNVIEVSSDARNDYDPEPVVCDNRLYIVWQKWEGSNDADIVLRCYDGSEWSNVVEVTSADDCIDSSPNLVVYKNELYVVWSTDNRNISNGNDRDIVMRKYNSSIGTMENKNAWSDTIEITPKNDYGDDDYPEVTGYNDKLYFVWITNDNKTSHGDDYDVVMRDYNGSVLGSISEISSPSDKGDDGGPLGGSASLTEYHKKLYICWSERKSNVNWDIVIRYYDFSTSKTSNQGTSNLLWTAIVISVASAILSSAFYFVIKNKKENKMLNERIKKRKERRKKVRHRKK